ncbi:MAG TPA: hypothetical protein PK530_22210 [Anaerolineales bacterium]|nr:hypothetical protein [Anaerolineales bacterium]
MKRVIHRQTMKITITSVQIAWAEDEGANMSVKEETGPLDWDVPLTASYESQPLRYRSVPAHTPLNFRQLSRAKRERRH